MNNTEFLPVKMYGFYKTIYDYEFLLPPLATASIGIFNFGPIGAVAGAFGAIDLIAKHYGVCDKYYLTSSVLGWGALSSYKAPYYLADAIGVVAGLLIPTGVIHPHMDKIVAPGLGLLAGYSYMGPFGGGVGLAIGIVDEVLSSYNITHSYPLTLNLKNIATANLLLSHSARIAKFAIPESFGSIKSAAVLGAEEIVANSLYAKEMIAGGWSAMSMHSKMKEEQTESPALQLSHELYEVYSKIIPKEQLDQLIEKQSIALVTSILIIAKLGLSFSKIYQDTEEAFVNLANNEESWVKFLNFVTAFSKFLVPYVTNKIVTGSINNYFTAQLNRLASDELNDELLTNGTLAHLKQNRTKNSFLIEQELINSKVLIDKMNGDIDSISTSELLPTALTSTIKGCYAIGHLYSIKALGTIFYSSAYNELTSKITQFLSSKVYNYTDALNDLGSKIASKYEHANVNAESMTIYESNDFVKAGRLELIDQTREIKAQQDGWEMAMSFWSTAAGITKSLFNWLIIADHIYRGILPRETREEVFLMTHKFSTMISWDSENVGPITELKQSMNRISELKARFDEMKMPLKHQPNYHYNVSEQTGICLDDFRVGKGEESRLYIDKLCIMEKNVAVTGPSGVGKSVFFKAIKKIVYAGVWSEGSITYLTKDGDEPSIAMTSQGVYITPEDSLLELITFKKGRAAESFREKVIKLLKEIKIDATAKEGEILLINSLY